MGFFALTLDENCVFTCAGQCVGKWTSEREPQLNHTLPVHHGDSSESTSGNRYDWPSEGPINVLFADEDGHVFADIRVRDHAVTTLTLEEQATIRAIVARASRCSSADALFCGSPELHSMTESMHAELNGSSMEASIASLGGPSFVPVPAMDDPELKHTGAWLAGGSNPLPKFAEMNLGPGREAAPTPSYSIFGGASVDVGLNADRDTTNTNTASVEEDECKD